MCRQLELTTKNFSIPARNDESINKKLSEIYDVLSQMNTTPLKGTHLEHSLTRIEKNVDSLVQQNTTNCTPSPSTDTEEEAEPLPEDNYKFGNFTNIKDDISYAVISCFSVYFLYKLLFS